MRTPKKPNPIETKEGTEEETRERSGNRLRDYEGFTDAMSAEEQERVKNALNNASFSMNQNAKPETKSNPIETEVGTESEFNNIKPRERAGNRRGDYERFTDAMSAEEQERVKNALNNASLSMNPNNQNANPASADAAQSTNIENKSAVGITGHYIFRDRGRPYAEGKPPLTTDSSDDENADLTKKSSSTKKK